MPSMRRSPSQSGFSLVELMVVVVIMSVLASIGLPLAELAQRRGQEEDLRRALREIRGALDGYKRLVDQGRIEQVAGSSGYPPSLAVLAAGVKDAQSPSGAKIYLLRAVPRDPFAADGGGAAPEATWSVRAYASPPNDPKPGADVFDVHSMSPKVGMNGVPYAQW